MRQFFLKIILFFCSLAASGTEVVINETSGRDYYHLALTLTAEDFTLTHPKEYLNPKWPESTSGPCKIGENGYFVIYIAKSAFPVPAPNCRSDWIKVTMAGNSDEHKSDDSKIIIWRKIKSVQAGELESVDVAIELNPYVKVLSKKPLELEMTDCNAFFRTAWGEYVDHVGAIE